MSVAEKSLANLRPFQKGQSGNPAGRPKQIATRLIREVGSALAEGSDKSRLERIVDHLYDMAEGGDLDAIKVILDRLEGRPRQSVSLSVGQREEYERMVENMMEAEGCTREEAIAALALVKPEIGELLS